MCDGAYISANNFIKFTDLKKCFALRAIRAKMLLARYTIFFRALPVQVSNYMKFKWDTHSVVDRQNNRNPVVQLTVLQFLIMSVGVKNRDESRVLSAGNGVYTTPNLVERWAPCLQQRFTPIKHHICHASWRIKQCPDINAAYNIFIKVVKVVEDVLRHSSRCYYFLWHHKPWLDARGASLLYVTHDEDKSTGSVFASTNT